MLVVYGGGWCCAVLCSRECSPTVLPNRERSTECWMCADAGGGGECGVLACCLGGVELSLFVRCVVSESGCITSSPLAPAFRHRPL